MKQLKENLCYLCDDTRMLTGITAAYGTAAHSESIIHGFAQEVSMNENGDFIPHLRPLCDDSLYDLASLTKLFTCVLAMRLVEQGMLSFNETIGKIDPRFIYLHDVTVLDVMSFQANLQTDGRIDTADHREEGLRRLFCSKRADLPKIRLYSDINAMVMKYVIEQKTGMAFFDSLKQHVLLPLGMTETFSHIPSDMTDRCVNYAYEHRIARDAYTLRTTPGIGQPHDPKALLLSDHGKDLCGHAGLFSSRRDMVKFAQGLLSGALLSRNSLRAIGTNYTGVDYGDGTHRQYLGLLCFTKHPNQVLSEVPAWMGAGAFGLSGFTGNHLSIDPDRQCFVLLLGNRCHNRVSNIQLSQSQTLSDFSLQENGTGYIPWPDGRHVPSSARYVYFKDERLNNPIYHRMQSLGWI